MKQFWKDYGELCKKTGGFYKKHWKGVIVLNAAIIAAELVYRQYKYQLFDLDFKKETNKEEEAQ